MVALRRQLLTNNRNSRGKEARENEIAATTTATITDAYIMSMHPTYTLVRIIMPQEG